MDVSFSGIGFVRELFDKLRCFKCDRDFREGIRRFSLYEKFRLVRLMDLIFKLVL